MLDAVDRACRGSDAEREYAKIELRRTLLTLDLQAWESHPFRVRGDVKALLRRAVGRLTPHRGGWRVGGRDRAPASSVPANRQWLEWLPASR